MTRFIYFCKDNNEFIKFIENLDSINEKNGFFYSNEKNTFVIEYSENSEFEKNFLIEKFEDVKIDFPDITNDIVFISIHPGGTSIVEIIKKLERLNKEIINNIYITYHGSQNHNTKEILDNERFDFDTLNTEVEKFFKEHINDRFYNFLKKDLEEFLLVEEKFAEQLTKENHSDNLFIEYKEITNKLINKRIEILKTLDKLKYNNQ